MGKESRLAYQKKKERIKKEIEEARLRKKFGITPFILYMTNDDNLERLLDRWRNTMNNSISRS